MQSRDGKAAYVELNLAGDQGSTQGNESVDAVRALIDSTPAPHDVSAYLTGPAALSTDMNQAADKSMITMMGVTGVIIIIMLSIAYRAISTVLLVLAMVGVEMGTARGVVAILGNYDLLGFSTFVVAMLSSLAIAAGTDYAIFLIGRYREARAAGQDPETAYYTMFARDRAHHRGLRADHRRGHPVPAPGPAVVFQSPGRSLGTWAAHRRCRRPDRSTGDRRRRQPASGCSTPNTLSMRAVGGASAPRRCAGPPRCWRPPCLWRWSASRSCPA